ncbi:hypothetical protein [Bowmanella dokdonensis]|uniref:Uncharacterized protein n=1 Tax=Bowmanella dokdonensis TaxID=751969 RepID=A0A939DSV5_9ALTE|nr:hypothetical protein [Bowmanella dokdonensis]MBN7827575.1 hypothetical protein [Bowmanella dokdonensis]
MNSHPQNQSDWQANLKGSTLKLGIWTVAWLLSTALLAFGPKFIWQYATLYSSLAVALNLLVGALMILSNIKHVRAMDELERKIFMDASAITLGMGVVAASSYGQLQNIGLMESHPEISHLVILMGLTFLGAVLFGNWRYR